MNRLSRYIFLKEINLNKQFNYIQSENIYSYDLFGLANILMFLAGKGDVLLADLKNQKNLALNKLYKEDLNIVFHNRVANLKKFIHTYPNFSTWCLCIFQKVLICFMKTQHN